MELTKHARKRLHQRRINLDSEILNKLSQMADKALEKGSKDSLFLIEKFAFIVNIKNKKLVTVFNKSDIEENIITNVDSVVFA